MGRWHSSSNLTYQKNMSAAAKAALVMEQTLVDYVI